LKPYSTAYCNMTALHDESAAGLVETYLTCKVNHKPDLNRNPNANLNPNANTNSNTNPDP